MTLAWPSKDPLEIVDYDLDWSLRLGSDTISSSVWSILGSPTSLVISSQASMANRTKVFLSGGLDSQTYTLRNVITTLAGETMAETVRINIKGK